MRRVAMGAAIQILDLVLQGLFEKIDDSEMGFVRHRSDDTLQQVLFGLVSNNMPDTTPTPPPPPQVRIQHPILEFSLVLADRGQAQETIFDAARETDT